MIDYDGLEFHSSAAETADEHGAGPVGHYHQRGSVVWAEFAGGAVVSGNLVGESGPDGVLRLAYCQLLRSGEVVSGRCVSTPERLADGRIRLREQWRRYHDGDGETTTSSTGVSYIESTTAAGALLTAT